MTNHFQYIFNHVPKKKCYDKISNLERTIADNLYNRAAICDKTAKALEFVIPQGTTGNNVMKALMVQHFPYTWYIGEWYSVTKTGDKTRIITLNMKTFRKLYKINCEVVTAIREIVSKMPTNLSGFGKATWLAEYISSSTKYAYEDDERDHQAWDCLVGHETICCGFAEGYKALCDYCGIRCDCLTSYDHEWNRVYINGKWYHVDTCWLATGCSKDIYLLTPKNVFYKNHMMFEEKCPIWKLK